MNQSENARPIVIIPAIQRYEIDCGGNTGRQVVGGEWVSYDDHVTSIKLMRSDIEQLEGQVAKLSEMLRDAKLEIKVFEWILKGIDQ